jgi:peroxiredoxin family protein
MTKWQANIRNMRDNIGNEINVIKGIRTFLDSLTLKISTLHSFDLLVIFYQIIGRSQNTWIFIGIAMKIANAPRKKLRKKIGKERIKKTGKSKKKWKKEFFRQAKSVGVQTSACHISWDLQQACRRLLQYQNFVGLQIFMLTLHCN